MGLNQPIYLNMLCFNRVSLVKASQVPRTNEFIPCPLANAILTKFYSSKRKQYNISLH